METNLKLSWWSWSLVRNFIISLIAGPWQLITLVLYYSLYYLNLDLDRILNTELKRKIFGFTSLITTVVMGIISWILWTTVFGILSLILSLINLGFESWCLYQEHRELQDIEEEEGEGE